MITKIPIFPDYVIEKKASIEEPKVNHKKIYLDAFISPLSDEDNCLTLKIGTTDFWSCVAVESSINLLHNDVYSEKIDLFKFPRQLVCHIIVVTSDQQLILCKRTKNLRYEKESWSASFEESIDAEMDALSDGTVNPVETVKRALGVKEELGLPKEIVDSALIKFIAIGIEWSYFSSPLITLVRLPSTTVAQVKDFFLGAHDREHSKIDSTPFTITNCLEIIRQNQHSLNKLHNTSRLRILCSLFSEFGYGAVISQIK